MVVNLGWKLSLVHKGYASAALLDTYQKERVPIIAEMLNKTTELFNQVIGGRSDISPVGSDTDLGVSYRGSSIVGEDDIRNTTLKISRYSQIIWTCKITNSPAIASSNS